MTGVDAGEALVDRVRRERPLDMAAADAAVAAVSIMNEAFESGPLETRKQLAEKLGVTEARVSQLLNGDGNIRVSTLARVLAACGGSLVLERHRGPEQFQSPHRADHKRPNPVGR